MARRSNKTAHVLNLIAGHDAAKDNTDNAGSTASDSAAASSEAGHSPAPQTHAAPAAQNISVIDTTEEDPVADLIQQNLSHEFLTPESQAEPGSASQQTQESHSSSEPEAVQAPEVLSETDVKATPEHEPLSETDAEAAPKPETLSEAEPDTVREPNVTPAPEAIPEAQSVSEPAGQLESVPVAESAPDTPSAVVVEPEPIAASAPVSEPEPVAAAEPSPVPESPAATNPISDQGAFAAEPVSAPEPIVASEPTPDTKAAASEPEPEPDFVRLNVMEGIVKDKIIYFMRQFDVCTCDRCVNDTIALTMNGLLPKYIVTTPAAVDPLMSYYTNRLISDVTVEATKACITVKDNPRH